MDGCKLNSYDLERAVGSFIYDKKPLYAAFILCSKITFLPVAQKNILMILTINISYTLCEIELFNDVQWS